MFDKAKPTEKAVEITPPTTFPTMVLSVDQLATELCLSRPSAYALARQPSFPSFRVGQRILINRAALQKWLDDRCIVDEPTDGV